MCNPTFSMKIIRIQKYRASMPLPGMTWSCALSEAAATPKGSSEPYEACGIAASAARAAI